MNRVFSKSVLTSILLFGFLFAGDDISKIDINKVCNVKANGVEKLLEVAKKYNPIAVEKHVEFKRLGYTNTQYIQAIEDALANGKKEIVLVDKDGNNKQIYSIEYAANRACRFAIAALQFDAESDYTYKEAIPGEGFHY